MNAIGPLPPLPSLPPAVPRAGVSAAAREALKRLLANEDRVLAEAFANGIDAGQLVHRRADVVGRVLVHAWRTIVGHSPGMALFAVGGFGRGLLFPHSDVDLLVLTEQAPDAASERALRGFFTCLWDLGLKPGQALRQPHQCRELAAGDVSVFTSLLDARYLVGDASMQRALRGIIHAPGLWEPQAYLDAKLAEQRDRHARHDDTAHNLEPNLKDGPGGLRTLDVLRWLGLRLSGAGTFAGMVAAGLLDPAERTRLADAEVTLQRYRFALHLEAGRAEERLLFDYQRALAKRLGFKDDGAGNLDVEQFMQAYYRAATIVERLGVQLGERFEELLEATPSPVAINHDFARLGKRVEAVDPELFKRRPEALVEAFALRIDHPELGGFSATTMRHIQQAVASHGAQLAENPEVLAAFAALLRRGAPAARALWRMNRFGLLAAMVPVFGAVVGRMQYDLFHVYTVDEHTVRVLLNVARFADPGQRRDFPLGCEVYASLRHPEILLLAALFHDIAKGRGGDHSVLGAQEARSFCDRLGMAAEDAELVAWLVRWHLLMSTTAQRQDITDPAVVQRFASRLGDWEHLDYLYLLTVADIVGTNPKLWNAWKDRLLSDLYVASRYALRSDPAPPLRGDMRVHACRERALALLVAENIDADRIARVWSDFPDVSFLRHRPEQIAWQTKAILRADGKVPLVEVHPFSVRGTTEAFVYAPDRDGLFADITATLDRQRFSVMEARVLSSNTGMALDTFLLLESETQAPASLERVEVLCQRLQRALQRDGHTRAARRGLPRRLRHFQMQPHVQFTHEARVGRTQMALVCSDRPGLLATIAQVFVEAAVRVHDARIATFGERVEDFFLLSDGAGMALNEHACDVLRGILESRLGPAVGGDDSGNGNEP